MKETVHSGHRGHLARSVQLQGGTSTSVAGSDCWPNVKPEKRTADLNRIRSFMIALSKGILVSRHESGKGFVLRHGYGGLIESQQQRTE